MFVDKVQVSVQAGRGGDGKLSFRHEKFIQKGGPDGGDGGNGGDVILVANHSQDTLATFRYKKLLKAESGRPGETAKKHGKSGQDLVVQVPVGTVVVEGEQVLVDLTHDGQQTLIARGGKGGFGNAHFTSSTRQTPRLAEKGEPGEHKTLTLELKMIADVGLVGLPNSGKSTLLATISNAHPEIADYPFTTLRPNLGVVDIDKKTTILFADIPGLIEGASQGKGLGDDFLRHVERTAVLVHLVDAYEEVAEAYKTIQDELKAYKIDLSKRPQIVVLNKIDGLDKRTQTAKLQALRKVVPRRTKVMAISAKSGEGVQKLLFAVAKMAQKQRAKIAAQTEPESEIPVLRLPDSQQTWKVTKTKDGFLVEGQKIERFAARTDFTNDQAVQRLRDIMHKMGIIHDLQRKGAKPGEVVLVGPHSLPF